jgi:hypothetical protein
MSTTVYQHISMPAQIAKHVIAQKQNLLKIHTLAGAAMDPIPQLVGAQTLYF